MSSSSLIAGAIAVVCGAAYALYTYYSMKANYEEETHNYNKQNQSGSRNGRSPSHNTTSSRRSSLENDSVSSDARAKADALKPFRNEDSSFIQEKKGATQRTANWRDNGSREFDTAEEGYLNEKDYCGVCKKEIGSTGINIEGLYYHKLCYKPHSS